MSKPARNKIIGSKIKELFLVTRTSQAAFARRVGMHPCHLNPYLNGRGDISSHRFMEILLELGIDVEAQLEAKIREQATGTKRKHVAVEELSAKLKRMPNAEAKALAMLIEKVIVERRIARKERVM